MIHKEVQAVLGSIYENYKSLADQHSEKKKTEGIW